MCIVSDYQHKNIRSKLADQGIVCLFIRYPDNHAADVYQFLKEENEQMILSRNVIWLNKSYAEYNGISTVNMVILPDEEDTIDLLDAEEPPVGIINPTVHQHLFGLERVVQQLTTSNNPNPCAVTTAVEVAMLCRIFDPDPEFGLITGFDDGSFEPRTYKEVMAHPYHKEWWKAICTEFKNMESKDVWQIHNRSSIPSGCKLIGNHWVFKRKDDGHFQGCTVARVAIKSLGSIFMRIMHLLSTIQLSALPLS
jgi:hypothetical protein